jgi:hypothetical protein
MIPIPAHRLPLRESWLSASPFSTDCITTTTVGRPRRKTSPQTRLLSPPLLRSGSTLSTVSAIALPPLLPRYPIPHPIASFCPRTIQPIRSKPQPDLARICQSSSTGAITTRLWPPPLPEPTSDSEEAAAEPSTASGRLTARSSSVPNLGLSQKLSCRPRGPASGTRSCPAARSKVGPLLRAHHVRNLL